MRTSDERSGKPPAAKPRVKPVSKLKRKKTRPGVHLATVTTEVRPLEMIELFPSGISIASTLGRPVLILKDQHGAEVLPVWMQPLDAGVALAGLSGGTGASPHAAVCKLLEVLELKLASCTFHELVGHHQYVCLEFRGGETSRFVRARADEAMSFCLQAQAKFFSTKTHMARCRNLDAEITRLDESLNAGEMPSLRAEMEISSKKHPYVM